MIDIMQQPGIPVWWNTEVHTTVHMMKMMKTLMAAAGVLLPHRGGASSSSSVGRRIKTSQGIARQGWNAEKAPSRVGATMVETDP
jgi:hypothetical protein